MIKLEMAQSHKRIQRFTQTIIHNKLYVFQTWGIYTSIRNFRVDPDYIQTVILAHSNGKCVGCCMYVPGHQFNVQVFVKKTHRKKGIGRLMLDKLKKKHPFVRFTPETSSQKNLRFYKSLLKNETGF